MSTKDGVLPYTIEVVEDDATLTAHAGLPLVLETMRALGVVYQARSRRCAHACPRCGVGSSQAGPSAD
jgi:hypothetical protein